MWTLVQYLFCLYLDLLILCCRQTSTFIMDRSDNLIPLKSDEGQLLLSQSKNNFYNPFIHKVFAKQIGRSNCGIQSAALLLSSAVLSAGKANTNGAQNADIPIPFTESNMFTFEATTKIATQEDIYTLHGLTLQQVADILKSHGKEVRVFHASETTVDEFRRLACKTLESPSDGNGVIVNYHMAALGQGEKFGGHHSPIGAYNQETDRFLIFDTWPDTEECWATATDLFSSMLGIDRMSGLSRGFVTMH